MTAFPQLRIRSEFSFRTAFGPINVLAERLAAAGCKTAGIVDPSTWGHVRFEKALSKLEIQPAFGAEMKIQVGDHKPTAWCLAEDLVEFYNFTSSQPTTEMDFCEAKGVIRFCGAALTNPDAFDYVDLNPGSIWRAKAAVRMSEATGRPLILTSDNNYPAPEDRDRFLAIVDGKKVTPQHLIHEKAELRRAFFFLNDDQFEKAYSNTFAVAERLQGIKLKQAPIINVPGDLPALVEAGRKYRLERGHIPNWSKVYQQRLEREMAMIAQKEFESYFIVVADLVCWAKERMLVGPARGSSAGSLVCFLLRITEVDPLVHGLLFERFIDINRNDLPDIDIDFNDQKREQCFTYLEQKYGINNVARIGNINTLKPKSVMAEVGKRLGVPAAATFAVRNVLIEYSSGDSRYGKGLEDTMNNTQPGQTFQAQYPEAMVMADVENHAWHAGVHAAGIIVSNEPVINYCTVIDGIAQIDKPDSEYLNLLKIDALGLRTLGIIEDAGCVTQEELYAMKFDDPAAFDIINKGKFSGVFQFEGAAQRRVSLQVPIEEFKQIDHVTALARPGPLGGGAANHYINRNAGREAVSYRHPSMAEYLGDTHGVVLYQEQVMRIVREIGKFSWEETSVIRKAMSGRKGKEFFDKRGEMFAEGAATQGISREDAMTIWNEICSFGAWGMNKSHTCSYAMISYYCCHMKAHHPLEYAAACLRNAKDDEQVVEILRELSAEGVEFTPFDPLLSDVNWSAKEGKLLGGFTNVVGIGKVKATNFVKKRDAGLLTEKDIEKLRAMKVQNSELRPAHAKWADIYCNPGAYNINGVVKEFADLQDMENAVVVCKLVRKERRDENEAVRLARRGGKRKEGHTLFLDAFVVDDSVSKPIVMRIKSKLWHYYGQQLADRAIDGEDWFLVRGKWLAQFSMITAEKIKCLTNEEMFNA